MVLQLGSSGDGRTKRGPGRRAERLRLRRQIRDRIVGGIHAGRYNIGDRLPTYRELGEDLGANLRVVQSIYRELADEGLVEVRERSGVFVASQERIGGVVLAETARWMVQVLAQRGCWPADRGIRRSRLRRSCQTAVHRASSSCEGCLWVTGLPSRACILPGRC